MAPQNDKQDCIDSQHMNRARGRYKKERRKCNLREKQGGIPSKQQTRGGIHVIPKLPISMVQGFRRDHRQ